VESNHSWSRLSPNGDGKPLILSCQGPSEQIDGNRAFLLNQVSKKGFPSQSLELRRPAPKEIPSGIKDFDGGNEIGVNKRLEVGGSQGLFSIHPIDFVGNAEEVIRHRFLQTDKEIGKGGGDLKAPWRILQNLKGSEHLLNIFFIMLKEDDGFSF
jgi:hypothetical protein